MGSLKGAEDEETKYRESDFHIEREDFANCTVEYVSPPGFKRKEYKKPAKAPREYKFKLDKF